MVLLEDLQEWAPPLRLGAVLGEARDLHLAMVSIAFTHLGPGRTPRQRHACVPSFSFCPADHANVTNAQIDLCKGIGDRTYLGRPKVLAFPSFSLVVFRLPTVFASFVADVKVSIIVGCACAPQLSASVDVGDFGVVPGQVWL